MLNQNQIEILVIEAKHGERRALTALYKHFLKPMRRFAYIRTGDVMIAEDLVHNVWLKIDKRLNRLNDVSIFRSWLYRALKWEILDWAKNKSKQAIDNADDIDTFSSQSQFDLNRLIPIYRVLTEKERDVVELYYLNDLSLIETAQALSLAEGTVKSRLSSARYKLRENINNGE